MRIQDTLTFALENFEGPLPLLLHLIQRAEIDVYEVSLFALGGQFLQLLEENRANIDQGAEFIATLSFLLCLKSRALLPKEERPEENFEEDPHFDIIHHLVDYCRFKGAAQELSQLEKKQSLLHARGLEPGSGSQRQLGIEHLTLDDLAVLFRQLAIKVPQELGKIEEENWKVSDKLESLSKLFERSAKISFEHVFERVSSRLELIVTFLALLELMKVGKLMVVKDLENDAVWVSLRQEVDHA